MELADALLINKADGDNLTRAKVARGEYTRAVHYLAPATQGWRTQVHTCSAVTGDGIAKIWSVIEDFRQKMTASGTLEARRHAQAIEWVYAMIEEHLRTSFYHHPAVVAALPAMKEAVINGSLPATLAATELLAKFERERF